MLISQRLERLANDYDDSRRTVSVYLLNKPAAIERESMAQIAEATYTSKATLVRVAKQLGFSGWTEFSRSYLVEVNRQRERAAASDIDHSIPFRAGMPARDVMEAIALVHTESAWQTRQIADVGAYEQAARLLARAHHIYLVGLSTSHYCVLLFYKKLLDIGIEATAMTMDEGARQIRLAGPDDCVLAVSYSGEGASRNLLSYIPEVRARGARVIAVTSEGESFLRDNADVTLPVFSDERLFDKISMFSSTASIQCALDMLYACVFALDYEHNLKHNVYTSKVVDYARAHEGATFAPDR